MLYLSLAWRDRTVHVRTRLDYHILPGGEGGGEENVRLDILRTSTVSPAVARSLARSLTDPPPSSSHAQGGKDGSAAAAAAAAGGEDGRPLALRKQQDGRLLASAGVRRRRRRSRLSLLQRRWALERRVAAAVADSSADCVRGERPTARPRPFEAVRVRPCSSLPAVTLPSSPVVTLTFPSPHRKT